MANEHVNVDQAGEAGKNVLKLMENQTGAEFSFKSSWKFVNMAIKFKISSKHEEVFIDPNFTQVLIDPNLLFPRLTATGKNSMVSLEHQLKFKLSPFPATLAKSPTEMHLLINHNLLKV